jgi:hypothetical protein
MKNTYKDIDKAEFEANQALEEAKNRLKEIEDQKVRDAQEKLAEKRNQKKQFFADAQKLRDDAIIAIKDGDYAKAESLKGFAEEMEQKARAIVIEGEEEKAVTVENETPHFTGEGISLNKAFLVLGTVITILYFISGYVNHFVRLGTKSISISIGAEWVHAMQTTQFWALCWLVSFAMLYLTFRSISRFINPKTDPNFDLTTKLFTECTPSFQIVISIVLLLSLVLSWCLVYLHNPVSNAG